MVTELEISRQVSIPLSEIRLRAVRSSGPGGQNVNKVATAIHLKFNFEHSSLPDFYKTRLRAKADSRITEEGWIVIKAEGTRSQEANRTAALNRLQALVRSVAVTRKKRKPTRVTKSSKKRRLDKKKQRGDVKKLRRKPLE